MQKIKKYLGLGSGHVSFRTLILLLMPVCIFFSYHPMIDFGQASGMHFEISLIEVYLVIFVLVNLKSIWENLSYLSRNKGVWLAFAFAIFNTISLLWTPNFVKGFLICGVIWLLFLSFLAMLCYGNLKKLLPTLTKILIISACAVAVFGLFQMFAEVVGISQNWSLLCDGCRASQLGFARITGFSIEPQFFGSLLVAPIFLLLFRFIKNPRERRIYAPLILLIVALFLTMSRGAIYAFLVGAIVLFVLQRKLLREVLWSIGIIAGSFAASLIGQGLGAQLNPSVNITFYEAATKSVHQLSLGIIDVRPATIEIPAQEVQNSVGDEEPSAEGQQDGPDEPVFDGYIEESTNTRMLLSELALRVWISAPRNLLIGVGTGGTGFALYEQFPDEMGDSTEITQNQYTETALESGLIGLAIFGTLIVYLFWVTREYKHLWAIFVTFLVQWAFFSGYPNALHIYLFSGMCIAVFVPKRGVKLKPVPSEMN